MGGQRTFTLIPQNPGPVNVPDAARFERPMTSKQVQKAYKAANRGPRMSRVERIKQERAEQERIRKEFEKERAASKAKQAREKKKGKLLAEREEKRKKGLPLVSVRPSQDTISRFVRGNGTAKKRDAEGERVEERKLDPVRMPGPPAPNLDDIIEDEEGMHNLDAGTKNDCPPIQKAEHVGEEEKTDEKTDEKGGDERTTEEDGGFTQDLDDYFGIDAFAFANSPVAAKPPSPLEKKASDLDDLDLDDFEEDLALEILQDVEASAKKAAMKEPNTNKQPIFKPPVPSISTPPNLVEQHRPREPTRYEQDLGLNKRTPMAPPPRPSATKPVRSSPPSPSPPRQAPPLSTQAILCNFDDFFPSPSQQARELEEETLEEAIPCKTKPPPPPLQPQKFPVPPEPSLPEPRAGSPSPPPRRFFTSSGSHELMSLALQRSRRTAELEKIQERDRLRTQTGMAFRNEAEATARAQRNNNNNNNDHLKLKPVVAPHAPLRRNLPPVPFVVKTNAGPQATNNRGPISSTKTITKATTPGVGLRKAPIPAVLKTNTKPPLLVAQNPRAKAPALIAPNANTRAPVPHQQQQQHETTAPIAAKMAPTGGNKENKIPKAALPPAQMIPSSQESEYGGGDWMDDIALELMI